MIEPKYIAAGPEEVGSTVNAWRRSLLGLSAAAQAVTTWPATEL